MSDLAEKVTDLVKMATPTVAEPMIDQMAQHSTIDMGGYQNGFDEATNLEQEIDALKKENLIETRKKRLYMTSASMREWLFPLIVTFSANFIGGTALIVPQVTAIISVTYGWVKVYSFWSDFKILGLFMVAGIAAKLLAWKLLLVSKLLLIGRSTPNKYWRNSITDMRIRAYLALARRLDVGGNLENTVFMNLFYRSMGAKVGKNVYIHTTGVQTSEILYDLLSIGDNAVIEDEVSLGSIQVSPDGTFVQTLPTAIGKETLVGNSAFIAPGSNIGTNVSVFPASHVQGSLPNGSRWRDQSLVPLHEEMPMPLVTVHLKEGHSRIVVMIQTFVLLTQLACANVGMGIAFIIIGRTFGYAFMQLMTSWTSIFMFLGILTLFQNFTLITLAVLCKWICIGKLRAGTFRITRSFYFRYLLCTKMVSLVQYGALPYFFMSTFWQRFYMRALGGSKISFRATTGNLPKCGGLTHEIDLLSIGAETYLSALPYISCAEVSCTADIVTYTPVSIGRNSFVGFSAMLLPGAILDPHSGVGECAVVNPGETIRRGTIKVGHSKLLAYRSDNSEPTHSNSYVLVYTFCQTMCYHMMDIVTFIPMMATPAFLLHMLIVDPTLIDSPVTITIALVATSLVCVLTVPMMAILAIAGKWLLIGNTPARRGLRFEDRSFFIVRWFMVGRLVHALNLLLQPAFDDSPIVPWLCRLFGSKVGKDARISQLCASPDYDCYTFGNKATVSGPAIYFAHKFSGGGLRFDPVTIGDGTSVVGSHSRQMLTVLLPGVTLKEHSSVGPATLLMPGEYAAGSVLKGNPGMPARIHETGLWVRDQDQMLPQLAPHSLHSNIIIIVMRLVQRFRGWLSSARDGEQEPLLGSRSSSSAAASTTSLHQVVVTPDLPFVPPKQRPSPLTLLLSGPEQQDVVAEAGSYLRRIESTTSASDFAELSALSMRTVQARAGPMLENGHVVVGRNEVELAQRLASVRSGRVSTAGTFSIMRLPQDAARPRVALMFGGDSSYINMGRELYATNDTYRRTIDECDRLLKLRAGFSVLAELYQDPATVTKSRTLLGEEEPGFAAGKTSAAAMFCVQHAIHQMIVKDWGVHPVAVLGYSNGEIAASVAAGVITREDAIDIFAAARFEGFVRGRGAMATVSDIEWSELVDALHETGDRRCVISGVYSRSSYMLSGPKEAVFEAKRILEQRGYGNVALLRSAYPSHCELLQIHINPRTLRSIQTRKPATPYASCTTGGFVESAHVPHSKDWSITNDQPVRFNLAMEALMQEAKPTILLDLSARADLTYYYNIWRFEQEAGRAPIPAAAIPTLRLDHDAAEQLALAAGACVLRGVPINPDPRRPLRRY